MHLSTTTLLGLLTLTPALWLQTAPDACAQMRGRGGRPGPTRPVKGVKGDVPIEPFADSAGLSARGKRALDRYDTHRIDGLLGRKLTDIVERKRKVTTVPGDHFYRLDPSQLEGLVASMEDLVERRLRGNVLVNFPPEDNSHPRTKGALAYIDKVEAQIATWKSERDALVQGQQAFDEKLTRYRALEKPHQRALSILDQVKAKPGVGLKLITGRWNLVAPTAETIDTALEIHSSLASGAWKDLQSACRGQLATLADDPSLFPDTSMTHPTPSCAPALEAGDTLARHMKALTSTYPEAIAADIATQTHHAGHPAPGLSKSWIRVAFILRMADMTKELATHAARVESLHAALGSKATTKALAVIEDARAAWSKEITRLAATLQLPRAGMKNSQVTGGAKKLASSLRIAGGTLVPVQMHIVDPDWNVKVNAFGVPLHRYVDLAALVRVPGQDLCFELSGAAGQAYQGNERWKALEFDIDIERARLLRCSAK